MIYSEQTFRMDLLKDGFINSKNSIQYVLLGGQSILPKEEGVK